MNITKEEVITFLHAKGFESLSTDNTVQLIATAAIGELVLAGEKAKTEMLLEMKATMEQQLERTQDLLLKLNEELKSCSQ